MCRNDKRAPRRLSARFLSAQTQTLPTNGFGEDEARRTPPIAIWGGPGASWRFSSDSVYTDLGRTDPPTRLSWMAAEGDALVGHIELGLDRDTASGLGRALEVAWAIDWIEEVTLRVYTWNTPALALYRSLGFVTRNVAIQDRAVDGEHWEAATMALPRAG